ITHKEYIPIIKVEEHNSHFAIDLMIENNKQPLTEPIPLNQFISQKKYEDAKFDVLKDLTLLAEHFIQLKEVIHSNGNKKLIFNSIEFTEILLKILPVIKLFGISILLPKALQNLIRPQLSLNMQAKGSGKVNSYLDLQQMLSFEWQIAIGNESIDVDDFKKLVKQLSGVVKIKDQFVLLDQNEIEKLFKNLNKPPQLSVNELLKTALTEEYNNAKIQFDENVRELLDSIIKVEKVELPQNLNATLRPYQVTGYEWMVKNANLGLGSLIADDMGLGKTLQVISVLLKFKQDGCFENKKALIIVPTTILTNWQKEIEKFTPGLKPFIYHGQKRKLELDDNDCVITTYGIIRSEIEKFHKIQWHSVVIDEAQNIKNPVTAQTKAVKKLKFDVKIAMSGTPVENRLSEYWSILDFTNKGYLGSLNKFTEEFARPIQLYRNHEKIDTFRKISRPFILRRLKSDKSIIKDLPDKVENNQYCSLTKEQAALYQNVVNNIMNEIENEEGIARKGLVLKLMTALKQICNHPVHFLKKGKLEAELSGKSTLLFNILENIYENNEKTLIFTQYKEMGNLLVQLIEQKFGTTPLFLHGGTVRKNRDKMVDDFQQRKHIKTFILSLKAGGTGLNLTAAKNVIHYDLWWNPAVEAQATDRTYRIGQTERVMVYRLLTKGTFEEKIEEMLKDKKELADLTVSVGEKWIGELSNRELKDLVTLRL
ncbi:MAG: DEAD/DEAH box helicase, partial [bacterium]